MMSQGHHMTLVVGGFPGKSSGGCGVHGHGSVWEPALLYVWLQQLLCFPYEGLTHCHLKYYVCYSSFKVHLMNKTDYVQPIFELCLSIHLTGRRENRAGGECRGDGRGDKWRACSSRGIVTRGQRNCFTHTNVHSVI